MRRALITQSRVVGALILRETRVRYGRSQIGYLWAIIQPMIWILAISAMFSMIGSSSPHGSSKALFVALGYLPFSLYRDLANQLGNAFNANAALLNFPIVKEMDTVFARAILELATTFVIITIILSGIVYFEGISGPNNLFKILEAILGIFILGCGIGLLNAVIGTMIKSWMNIYGLIGLPLLWISAIFYSLESMPSLMQNILSWNPIVHGVEAMRVGYYHNYRAASLDLTYLYSVGAICLLVGLAAERAIRIRK